MLIAQYEQTGKSTNSYMLITQYEQTGKSTKSENSSVAWKLLT